MERMLEVCMRAMTLTMRNGARWDGRGCTIGHLAGTSADETVS